MIKKLLKGDVRLSIVFWIYTILVAVIYFSLARLMEYYILYLYNPMGNVIRIIYILFPFIYFPIMFVAIWRSAGKYKQKPILAVLTQFAVIFLALGLVVLGFNTIKKLRQVIALRNENLQTQIEYFNKMLPLKKGDLELTHTYLKGKSIIVDSKFYNKIKSEINFTSYMQQKEKYYINTICETESYRKNLKSGYTYIYNFSDKYGNNVGQIQFNEQSCAPNKSNVE